MAKAYFEKLSQLVEELEIENQVAVDLMVKHFFSGAALYANGIICASWSPAGLAFKLTDAEVANLIEEGIAKPLKYFNKGNTKKGYALFENPETKPGIKWKEHILNAIKLSQNEPTP